MTLETIQREKIKDALLTYRQQFDGTDRKFANKFGINESVFSLIKRGKGSVKKLADDEWVRVGRILKVPLNEGVAWDVVKTETFEYLTRQFAHCKQHSVARLFVDKADIGKTTAATYYMLNNPNVFYIDCSLVKGRRDFIKALATQVGVKAIGSLQGMIEDIGYMLQATRKPLVILDEAGDLKYEAFLEIKALWNALEGACGWYMMGADGLKKKIELAMHNLKVGYAEIFRRFGNGYNCVTPQNDKVALQQFMRQQAQHVIGVNLPNVDERKIIVKDNLSLTRVKENIIKERSLLKRAS
ncbi:MAG: ATP-binding protein [Taibaiella sp.]|nr:ATP-binding protein [Taibaiella sp.]